MGDIVSNINCKNRIGYDVEERVIRAARLAHKGVTFATGTFDDITGKKIDICIAINFLHTIDDVSLEGIFDRFFRNNDIKVFAVDKVQHPPYRYAHDYETLLKRFGYTLMYKSQSFAAWDNTRRRYMLFEKNDV